jgi:tetratricopeptide (TPR) repeat protein
MPRVAFSVFALCCLVFAAPASADDWKDCQAADPDLSIKGCSAIVAMAYFNRANAYHRKGEYDRAFADFGHVIADYSYALEQNPKDAKAYNNRGEAYHRKGEYDRAIADYDRALELNPKYAGAYNNRGLAYGKKGEYDRAIADFGRALKLNPKDAVAYNNRGSAYQAKGEYDRAIADYGRALELNPRYAYAYHNRGHAHFVTGDFAKASEDFLHLLGEIHDATRPMLFRYISRARLGENAAPGLVYNTFFLKTKEWPYAVFELYLGKRLPDATLAAASKPDEECEANFYVGEWHILQNRPADAEPLLRKVAEACPTILYTTAQAELKRLKQ